MKIEKKIGIFGGSFNPIHIGHLICAEWVYEQLKLDELIFLPSGIPPHKQKKEVISGNHRKEMVRMALENYPYFSYNTMEVDSNVKHYTYHTIKKMMAIYPNVKFYFIVGGDMVDDLKNWYRIDDLVQLVQFVGINRPGSKMQTNYPIITLDFPMLDISSSLIRNRIKEGKSIRFLVPDQIIKYINTHQLYNND